MPYQMDILHLWYIPVGSQYMDLQSSRLYKNMIPFHLVLCILCLIHRVMEGKALFDLPVELIICF